LYASVAGSKDNFSLWQGHTDGRASQRRFGLFIEIS